MGRSVWEAQLQAALKCADRIQLQTSLTLNECYRRIERKDLQLTEEVSSGCEQARSDAAPHRPHLDHLSVHRQHQWTII